MKLTAIKLNEKWMSKLKLNKIKKLNVKTKVAIPAVFLVVLLALIVVFNLNAGPQPVVAGLTTGSHNKAGSPTSNSTSPNNSSAGPSSGNSKNNAKGTVNAPITPVVTPVNPPASPRPSIVAGVVGPNLVTNGSAEDSSAGAPTGWSKDGWGTNTTTYNYLSTGHTGGHSLQVGTTAWTDGDAKWGFNPVPVTPGTSYQFSDFYQSTVDTEVDAAYTVNGVLSFYNLGAAPASSGWNSFTTQFTAPAGATSVVIYHILNKVGSLTTDDYFLGTYSPAGFNRGIVTLNFDDGWLNQYQNAVPVLEADSLPATFFIITDSSITNPDPLYMNVTQLLDLKNKGFEIGDHTKTHPDLTTLTTAQIQDEMGGSQTVLQSAIGVTPTDFAYPYGTYNATTLAVGNGLFQSQRTVVSGFNTKDTLNLSQLKIEEVDSNITTTQVQAWVDQAIAQKTWLILVWHEVATTPSDPTDALYTTQPADLSTELSYIKSSGVAVENTQQAVAEVSAQ
jgi:peptidoglycan/xylan/chitin deacetylase (PgdA/CDA1 family)